GQLEPCGCSPDMRGGIGRAATIVERVRAEGSPVLLVDGGDRFFPHEPTEDPVAEQQRRMQAETLADITRLLRYDALIVGERDAAHRDFLDASGVGPWLDRTDTHVHPLGEVT